MVDYPSWLRKQQEGKIIQTPNGVVYSGVINVMPFGIVSSGTFNFPTVVASDVPEEPEEKHIEKPASIGGKRKFDFTDK